MIGVYVIIRTKSSGVHCGTLAQMSQDGMYVIMKDTSRIWRWRGANTLHELSLHGADEEYTRISEKVERIGLTEVIEVIPCTEKAIANLSKPRWG